MIEGVDESVEGSVPEEGVSRSGPMNETDVHLELPPDWLNKPEVVEEHRGEAYHCTEKKEVEVRFFKSRFLNNVQ